MTDYNTIGSNFKRGLIRFTKKISARLKKPKQKFVADMVFGMIASKSAKLTEIGRALKEEILLKKTVDRLGRNLQNFSQEESEMLMTDYLNAVQPQLGSDTMLLLDGGDVTKPCSSKMEAIGSVRDGSTGGFADGYWTMGAVALTGDNHHPVPVYEKLYPCKKEGGLGFIAEAKIALAKLREIFDRYIMRVFDRGFDSGDIMKDLHGNDEKFIIRANQNRVCVHKGKKTYINDVVRGIDCKDRLSFHSKTGNKSECRIGMTQVVLTNLKNLKLNLIVCKDFGKNPLVLYTNSDENLDTLAVRIVKAYLMRWRIEEYYAFKKQGLGLEGFRVRSLRAIRALNLLSTIAAGYHALMCADQESRLFVELIAISKRIPKLGDYLKKTKFFCFALLDGIACVLSRLRSGLSHPTLSRAPFSPIQLSLF